MDEVDCNVVADASTSTNPELLLSSSFGSKRRNVELQYRFQFVLMANNAYLKINYEIIL